MSAQPIYFHPTTGDRRSARDIGERYVIVSGHCPICSGKCVRIAHDIRETVIFEEIHRAKAMRHLADRGSKESFEVPCAEEFQVRGVNPSYREYSTESEAVCERCRHHVGRLVVPLNTIFGRTEDDEIMSGRYGIVLNRP